MIELLGPEKTGQGLSHYVLRVARNVIGNDRLVELVGFSFALGEDRVEFGADFAARPGPAPVEPKFDHRGAAGLDAEEVASRALGSDAIRIDRFHALVDDVRIDAILHVRSSVGSAE